MKNLQEAALRIKQAIVVKENIILLSDADLDGVASLLILEETIQCLGGKVKCCYFPNREIEGYGLSEKALNNIKNFSPGLLILTDTGISNFKEIKKAKKQGFFVLVIDHHEVIGSIPEADIVIDPKQPGDNYPFKLFSAAGLCFCLAKTLLSNVNQNILNEFFALAALATIADMMPQTDDNEAIIKQGLGYLPKSKRPAFLGFQKVFLKESTDIKRYSQKIISIVQLTDFINHLTESYILLKEKDLAKAKTMIKVLGEKSQKRKNLLKAFVEEIVEKEKNNKNNFIFYGDKDIPHLLTGSIASKVLQKLKKTTFVFSQKNKVSRGSCRGYKAVNVVSVLSACSEYLEVFGGHPPAAGFTVKNKNIDKLKKCLENYFN